MDRRKFLKIVGLSVAGLNISFIKPQAKLYPWNAGYAHSNSELLAASMAGLKNKATVFLESGVAGDIVSIGESHPPL
jgi:hypothetical protein